MYKTIINISFLALITIPIGILFLTLINLTVEEMRKNNPKSKPIKYNTEIQESYERPIPLRRVK